MALSVKCESCGKKLTISDDVYERRIAGRVVHVRCKSCQANIRIDGRAATQSEAAVEVEPEPAEEVKEPSPAEQPWPPEDFQAPQSEGTPELWAVDFGTSGHQELNTEEIYSGLRDGSISGASLVWTEGMDDWEPLAMVPTLAALIPASANSAPPSEKIRSHQATLLGFSDTDRLDYDSAPPPAANPKATLLGLASERPAAPLHETGDSARQGGSAKQTLLGLSTPGGGAAFASLETLDESDPTTVYDPEHGSGPYVAEAFGMPYPGPAAAAPPAAAPTPAAVPVKAPSSRPPAELASANPFLAPPGTFPGTPRTQPSSQPPATASQPPRSVAGFPPQPNAFPAVSGGRPAGFAPRSSQAQLELLAEEATPPKSRAPLIVALCAVAVAGASLAFIAMSARPETRPVSFEPPVENTASRRPNQQHSEVAPADTQTAAPADFAKTFATAAEQASASAGASNSTFNPERALAALRDATPKAKACYRVGGPAHAEVVIKFQPSGRASAVRVTGELAGTPTGMCLVSAFSDLEIASFQGAASEVRSDVTLN